MSNDDTNNQASYPAGLLDWAGHRKGGVRKPFDNETGRPLGKQLETKLVNQLNIWQDELIQNEYKTKPPGLSCLWAALETGSLTLSMDV